MKKIGEHLGSIIVALAGVALLVTAIVLFSAPIGGFFNNIIDKELGVGNQILDGIESPKAKITFTVKGIKDPARIFGTREYQAVEGMTWREWVESEYNTDGFIIEYVEYERCSLYINELPCGFWNTPVDDVIVAGEIYALRLFE